MKLSIVTTMYHSAPYVQEFYTRIRAAAEKVTSDYEIIFVNDGSPDESLGIAVSLFKKDQKVRVIDLSRNFGHHKAMMTGLYHTSGEYVFLIDCDLEEEPEILYGFYDEFINSDADVIYGVQQKRKGKYFEQITGSLFYKLLNIMSSYPVPANLVTARLMSRRYVNALVKHQDREVFMAGLWAITGFKQTPVIVDKHSSSTTTYNLPRKIAIFVNSITSFSNKPLIYVFYIGSIISFFSLIAALLLIIRRVFFNVLLSGWPSLIVSIWLLGGITIFCIGIIGIYVAKIFTESKQRPYTVIRKLYNYDGKTNEFR